MEEAEARVWEPRFLALAAMEFWERFALAGIKSLLVLILMDHVLIGDLSRILGATTAQAASTALFGPVSLTGLASQIYGYSSALVYLAMPIGGLLGDVTGSRRAMVIGGGAGMLLGLALMLSERTFLIGLVPFAIGGGILKGNLSAQVATLFGDEAQRRRGYAYYLGFLNGGVICGPLICGSLAVLAGPVYAIMAAAAAVGIGLALYGRTSRHLPNEREVAREAGSRQKLSPAAAVLLGVAIVAVYLCFCAYDQLANVFLMWARNRVDLRMGNWAMPVAWLLSLDGVLTLLLIACSQLAFSALDRRGARIKPLTQIAMGGAACAAGYLVLAAADAISSGGAVGLGWAVGYLLLVDLAIVLVWPSGLSLIAAVAPRRQTGFWMGLFYLHGFFSGLWVGFSGVYYDRMSSWWFWLLQASVAGTGAFLILIFSRALLATVGRNQATITSALAKAPA